MLSHTAIAVKECCVISATYPSTVPAVKAGKAKAVLDEVRVAEDERTTMTLRLPRDLALGLVAVNFASSIFNSPLC